MDCDLVQVGLSQRMDGVALSPTVIWAVDAHVEGCRRCATFVDTSAHIRTAVRIRAAEPVPDLSRPIMAAVARTAQVEPVPAPLPAPPLATPSRRSAPPRAPTPSPHPSPPRRRLVKRLTPIAAALVIGLIAGSLSVGGPFTTPPAEQSARAANLGRAVLAQATRVEHLQAAFRMVERGFSAETPVRRFDLRVRLSAPERFRLELRDRTEYEGAPNIGPNDLSYIVNGRSSYSNGPTACPAGLSASCPQRRTLITNRSPFSSSTPLPADLLLPVTTLGGLNVAHRAGPEILGRDTVAVQLPYERAAPLFPFVGLFPALDLGDDSWRPFFARDRVDLYLDAETLLPLRSEIYAASGDRTLERDRRSWELRFGLPKEGPGKPLLSIEATSLGEQRNPPSAFRIPRAAETVSEGAQAVSLQTAARRIGIRSDLLEESSGLSPYRAVTAPAGAGTQTTVAYARGLSWLKIGLTRDWSEPTLFGVDPQAERISLGQGIAYFEPGTDLLGRRLSIHTRDSDLLLETNLPREQLLAVAGALPLAGRAVPEAWNVQRAGGVVSRRVPLDEALRRIDFPARLPHLDQLPPGYVVASAELTNARGRDGLTVYYRQVDSDLAGAPIRIHQEPGTELAPPLSGSRETRIGRDDGLYHPDLGRLEWIHRGIYHSIESPALELPALMQLEASLRPTATAR